MTPPTFPVIFAFRDTLGFVTDPAGTVFVSPGASYSGAAGFGYDLTSAPDFGVDANAANPAGLQGYHARAQGFVTSFRVDLPASGDYDIRLAIGNYFAAVAPTWVEIYDNATLLHTIDVVGGTAAAHYLDANGIDRTLANWTAQNTPVTLTFASTILRVKFGKASFSGSYDSWALVAVAASAAGGSAAVTGTGGAGVTGAQVRAGGRTLILTLTGDTFNAFDNTIRQAIVNGIVAASSPTWGWNNIRAAIVAATAVVRTSATVCTITLPALPNYQSNTTEIVTITIPVSALVGGNAIVAAPTVAIARTVTDLTPVGDYNMTGTATRT